MELWLSLYKTKNFNILGDENIRKKNMFSLKFSFISILDEWFMEIYSNLLMLFWHAFVLYKSPWDTLL